MADVATYRTWLIAAESALQDLATGARVVEVWRDGRRLNYTPAKIQDLQNYIAELTAKIVQADPTGPEAATSARGALGVRFQQRRCYGAGFN